MVDLIQGTSVDEWIAFYLAIVGLASFVVKLTPTPKDDAILKKVVDFVSRFIALNSKEPKGK